MKKLFLGAFALVALAACTNSMKQSPAGNDSVSGEPQHAAAPVAVVDSANAPVMTFEETEFEFATVKSGAKVEHNFMFTNTGKSPLVITSAVASCGCTVPDYPKQPIAPGEGGVIKVVFNSEGKTGVQNKAVTVTSNAVPATTVVYLKGEVK